MRNKSILKFLSWWPPFLGAGIRVREMSPKLDRVEVEMKLTWWNRNYVGTHYGGSLYSMCDPFMMLMLIERLDRNYIVWDKSAQIKFKKPGRGTVRATFQLPDKEIERIKKALETQNKIEPTYLIEIKDSQNEVIAEVEKVIYIRNKNSSKTSS